MTCLAFDLDGTIYDCKDIIVDAFRQGIAEFIQYSHKNIKIPDKDKIISKAMLDENVSKWQNINEYCTKALVEMVNNGGGEIFDEVTPILRKFHSEGYGIFVASNGNINYIEAILKSNKLDYYFSQPIISLNIKDKTEIVKYYKDYICNDKLLIMIGDRESDKIAAWDNNIPFIGCSFGHADGIELQGVKWIATKFSYIYAFVKKIELEYNNE